MRWAGARTPVPPFAMVVQGPGCKVYGRLSDHLTRQGLTTGAGLGWSRSGATWCRVADARRCRTMPLDDIDRSPSTLFTIATESFFSPIFPHPSDALLWGFSAVVQVDTPILPK